MNGKGKIVMVSFSINPRSARPRMSHLIIDVDVWVDVIATNRTDYQCKSIECACIPGRFLCGEDGSVSECLRS